ncbi:MAG: 1-acyl-sn-glycerol-3-phosphate acyltransferase [Spirochaetales bacterium]|nr:1-acyl-sn-glycerol-3-phosphate acyltransferase [Spirochaetales bacterium]
MNYFNESADFRNPVKIIFKKLRGISPLGRLFIKITLLLFGSFIRIKNPEKMPLVRQNPVIFAFNHSNSFETILLAATLIYLRNGRVISFMIDWMFGKIPFLGLVFRQINPVYVFSKKARWRWLEKRKNKEHHDPVKESLQRLGENVSLGIYPEGCRNKNAFRLKRGKPGLGQIVTHSCVKILPIGIDYVQRRTRNRIPSIGRMELIIGDTIDFTELLTINLCGSHNHHPDNPFLASSITHQVMKELSLLCGKKYLHNPRIAASADKTLKKGA